MVAFLKIGSVGTKESLEAAVRRLVSVREVGHSTFVNIPVLYPSGSHAAVSVTTYNDHYFVSDAALGLQEAELAGIGEFYDRAAKDAAEWFGVSFDGASVFEAKAPLDRIDGAITAIANASTSAVGRALMRAAETKDRQKNEELFERVQSIFGPQNVAKQREVQGVEATWTAHNVVQMHDRIAVFEFVSDHGNAIASKYLMFSDLSRAAPAPSLNSVVRSIARMSPKQHMLGDVSNVVEIDAAATRFRELAGAA